jgi:tetratricopeptide (TPR) repeat protein
MTGPADDHRPAARRLPLAAEALALAVVFGLLAVYVSRSMYGIDVFWHVKTGEWIVQNGAIPEVDTFSAVAPDRPWTPFQWLYEVLVYGLDELGGLGLLRWSNAFLYLLGFALLYRALRRELGALGGFAVLLVSIVLLEDRFRVRPEVFNLLFLGLLLPVLFGGWRTVGWRGRLGVGVVAWLWANIHAGGALLVPVTLGGLGAGVVLRLLVVPPAPLPADAAPAGRGWRAWWAARDPALRDDLRRITILFAVAVLPMLVMPGFVKGVVTALTMYSASVSLIPEWREASSYFDMLDQRGVPHYLVCGFAPYVLMLAVGGWVVVRVLQRRTASLPWPELAMSALLLYLAQHSVRFVFLGLVPLTLLIRAARAHATAAPGPAPRRVLAAGLGLLALSAFAVSYHYNVVVQRGTLAAAVARLGEDLEPSRFPTEATGFLRDAQVEGGLLHLSKWGGYLLYELWPRVSVFSDGRGNFDLVQVGALVATHRPMTRETTLEAAWQLYGLDLVIFPAPVFPLERWDRRRWVRIYAGMEHNLPIEVFLRNSPDNRENLRRVRAWYAALPDPDPRLRSDELATFERAAGEYWGGRWLAAPAQAERLARLTEKTAADRPAEERADALFRRAMVHYNAGFVDRALVDLVALQHATPDDPRALYYLGWALYRTGRERDALGALAAAARLDAGGSGRLRADERMRGELLLRDLLERHGAGPPAEPARSAGPATAGGSAAERAGGSNSDAIPPN